AILGYKAREAQGQPIGDVIGAFEPIFSQTLREDKPFAFHEMTVCTKSGSHIPVEVSTSSLKNDTGETTGVVIIFTDLTERKEMEKQILRADKLATLGQLAAGIAHEIRNPLAGISGAAQILKDEIPKTDLHWEILDEIVEKIKTLENSISDFLRFARPAPLQLSPTDINEVVQSVLFLINKQREMQGVSIVTEYDDSLPIIMADAEQIQQVILNLALNALQAIDEKGGRVLFKTFQTSVPDPQIVVEISDTGVGIPPENLSRIFNPYFTTKGEGTGLGLSIAQRIVEEHGGSISVESEVGKGTTFRVSLSLSLKSSRKFTY
ncbi:MAG: nitrogen regulation protein NR(II), partial [Candidatus Poribacteria bacterium]